MKGPVVVSSLMIDNIQVPLSEFPQRALNLYQMATLSTPNRAINILGMARANAQLRNIGEAIKFYQMLLAQINLSKNQDPTFSQEATNFIAENGEMLNSANNNLVQFAFIFIISMRMTFQ